MKEEEQREAAGGGGMDPFDSFFGGFGGFGGRRQREEVPRTPNVEIPLSLSLKQLYLGEILDIKYYRQVKQELRTAREFFL